MRWLIKMLALEVIAEVVKDIGPRIKAWLDEDDTRYMVLFFFALAALVITLYLTGREGF